MNLVEEFRWRGMIHDIMPGTEEQLLKETTSAYVGIDPTADSLHIGHLVSIMMLRHLQKAGHRPIALIGGATGMIGDPSGKSAERNLLSLEKLRANQEACKAQAAGFLDATPGIPNQALILNNHDWLSKFDLLSFLREVGKHLSINYMLAKDSVKKRMENGLSFTEFSYQLLQAYDFFYLYSNHNCKLQMGGSDQWGNITAGTELIRRKLGGEAFALTCPLITKADGKKFGKTEKGNIWLDPRYTSPYQFYQFWLNVSDEDAERYIKIFTMLDREEIDSLIDGHRQTPHLRILQKRLAMEVTVMVHSRQDYDSALEASEILFGRGSEESLKKLSREDLLAALEGVPGVSLSRSLLNQPLNLVELLASHSQVFASKGEARRLIKNGGLSVNKRKISDALETVCADQLLHDSFLLVQKGKKKYTLLSFE